MKHRNGLKDLFIEKENKMDELKLTYSCNNCDHKIFNTDKEQPTFNYATNSKINETYAPICPKCGYEMENV